MRPSICAAFVVIGSVSASCAADRDVVASIFHTDAQYVVMNVPPRPNAWPGAIFTNNLRLPIKYGDPNDPAVQRGDSIEVDSSSGFGADANAQGGLAYLFGGSARASDAGSVVMTFPDARINDMNEADLRQHVISSPEAIDAAKHGYNPVVVIRSYSGTPTITVTKKAGASAEAWAKLKENAKVGAEIGISSGNELVLKAKQEIVFAFETEQVTFDPTDLSKGIYNIRFANLPGTLYIAREESDLFGALKLVNGFDNSLQNVEMRVGVGIGVDKEKLETLGVGKEKLDMRQIFGQ